MESPQLNTASAYVNNLLLARGLLRDARPIDFAFSTIIGPTSHIEPADSRDRHASSSQTTTAAEIINLVHDLILRRDRDSDQIASLSETLSHLRTASFSSISSIDHLKSQNKDIQRNLEISQSSLRAANTALSASESSCKAFKDELAKARNTLAQVRTQCANDIRKRDVQLQKLKTHLASTQRGSNARVAPPACTFTNHAQPSRARLVDVDASVNHTTPHDDGSFPSLHDAQYSLRQETTEFLAQLSQNLSDENDSLVTLIRNTLATLRQLQNLPPTTSQGEASQLNVSEDHVDQALLHVVPMSFNALSADLEFVLANLRAILTDASFVSIDEVFSRDEEISRLREGCEKMESRWHEAIGMLKGWQDRLLQGGATVNLEELRCGLDLGESLQSARPLEMIPLNDPVNDEDPKIPHPNPNNGPLISSENNLVFDTVKAENSNSIEKNSQVCSATGTSPGNKAPLRESSLNIASPSEARFGETNHLKQYKTLAPSDKFADIDDAMKENEAPMTIQQKLKHAESEARRISGTSASSSPIHSLQESSPNTTIVTTTSADFSRNLKLDDMGQETSKSLEKPLTTALDNASEDSQTSSPRNKGHRERRGAKPFVKATKGVKSTNANKFVSTRARTQAASDVKKTIPNIGTVNKRTGSKSTIKDKPGNTKVGDRPTKAADASRQRNRKKRKSTLSPEELEELMGLRRAEDHIGESKVDLSNI